MFLRKSNRPVLRPRWPLLPADARSADGLYAVVKLAGGGEIRVKTRKGLNAAPQGGFEVGIPTKTGDNVGVVFDPARVHVFAENQAVV